MAEEITAILQQLLSFISFLQLTQVRFNKWKYIISLNNRRFITLNYRRVNIFAMYSLSTIQKVQGMQIHNEMHCSK